MIKYDKIQKICIYNLNIFKGRVLVGKKGEIIIQSNMKYFVVK